MAATVEYIVADAKEAATILAESYPHESRSALQLDVIDPFALTLLASTLGLTGSNAGAPDVDAMLPVLKSAGTDGPWVLLVPPRLTLAVSQMSDQGAAGVAKDWASELSKWLSFEAPVEEAVEWLRLLRGQAQAAVSQGRPLLIYAMP